MIHPDPIIRRIHACMLAAVPPFLWGGPGTGKTARVFAYGTMTSRHVERWLLSRCEPIDLRPRVYREGRVIVTDAPEVERVGERRGVLFFDELNLATRETEGAALNLLDSPPAGVFAIAAGNPPAQGQAARHLGAPAANRFCHLDVEGDSRAFASGLTGGWGVAPLETAAQDAVSDAHLAAARILVATFVRRQPAKLTDLPKNPASAGRAWASPRTWEFTARLVAVSRALRLDEEDVAALVGGCIGEGIGGEFAAFVDARDLPDPEELLRDPASFAPPARVDRVIAACAGVVAAVDRDLTSDRWKSAWKLSQVILDAGQPDAAMVLADMLTTDIYSAKAAALLDERKIVKPATLMPTRIAAMIAGTR